MAPEAHGSQVLQDLDYGPKILSALTKMVLPYIFDFIKCLPSLMVEAIEWPQTLFWPPWPRGSGYRVKIILRTFSPSKYIPMPNFTQIGHTVKISIRYEYIYIYIYRPLYIRYIYIYLFLIEIQTTWPILVKLYIYIYKRCVDKLSQLRLPICSFLQLWLRPGEIIASLL